MTGRKIFYPIIGLNILLYFFIFYQLKFYPDHNDIFGILKISGLNGAEKWVNGFYGPGYTLISLFIGTSPLAFGGVYFSLVLIFILLSSILILMSKRNIGVRLILLSIINIFVFSQLGMNHSDGIFIYLLAIGGVLAVASEVVTKKDGAAKKKYSLLVTGAIIVGLSLLLRSHGIIFFVIIAPAIYYAAYGLNAYKTQSFIILMAIPIIMFFLSNFILCYNGLCVNWQLFNIYKFFHGVNWHEVNNLIDSGGYLDFMPNIQDAFRAVISSVYGVRYPAIIIFLYFCLLYVVSRMSSSVSGIGVLVLLIAVSAYCALVLPGIGRGVIPVYLLFFSTIFLLGGVNKAEVLVCRSLPPFVLTAAAFAIGVSFLASKELYGLYQYKSEVEYMDGLSNVIDEGQWKGDIFTDDFNLYLISGAGKEMYYYGGWTQIHPSINYDVKSFILDSAGSNIGIIVLKKSGYIVTHDEDLHSFIEARSHRSLTFREHVVYVSGSG